MPGKVIPFTNGGAAQATKRRILDAAEGLFVEHGFEATSVRAITTAPGGIWAFACSQRAMSSTETW